MKRSNVWTVAALMLLVVAGTQLAACSPAPSATASKVEPAHIVPVEGSDLKRVELTEKAAERIDLQTVPLREEQVTRNRTVGGEVVAVKGGAASKLSGTLVRVRLNESDLSKVDRAQPAVVLPLADDAEDADGAGGLTAEAVDDPEDADAEEAAPALYYMVDGTGHKLVPGQRVRIQLPIASGATLRKVVPYAAVIYDLHGETWVYIGDEEHGNLTFVRHQIVIDYIEGDLAYLTEGPPAGTEVVAVGVGELFGAESGVGGGH